MRLRLALTSLLVAATSWSAAHDEPAAPEHTAPVASAPEPWSDAWLLAHTSSYLHDDQARRAAMKQSLTNPDNLYSRMRIAAYGLGDAGWDALPAWTPRAMALGEREVSALRSGASMAVRSVAPALWDGETPETMAQWIALGRRVFFTYPLRPEAAAEHAIVVDGAEAIGLHRDPSMGEGGAYPGLVAFVDVDGTERVGITCALCHSTLEAGALVVGRARRDLDYGAMRLAWHRDLGEPLDPRLQQRLVSWGPGRADITEDDDADPVAIPDLWRLDQLRYLTQAATIAHDRHDGTATPLVLAIRQETQYIHANGERTRPPRELAWALAMFLYSLDAPTTESDARAQVLLRGKAVFDEHCRDCHGDASGSGDAVRARRVGTDPALADGTSRGTGLYRPAPLVGVAMAAPYLHDGTVRTLDDLFDRDRLRSDFDRGARGPGAVLGHAYGTRLDDHDRDALVAWLRTL